MMGSGGAALIGVSAESTTATASTMPGDASGQICAGTASSSSSAGDGREAMVWST